jgi:hypothetical protein
MQEINAEKESTWRASQVVNQYAQRQNLFRKFYGTMPTGHHTGCAGNNFLSIHTKRLFKDISEFSVNTKQ